MMEPVELEKKVAESIQSITAARLKPAVYAGASNFDDFFRDQNHPCVVLRYAGFDVPEYLTHRFELYLLLESKVAVMTAIKALMDGPPEGSNQPWHLVEIDPDLDPMIQGYSLAPQVREDGVEYWVFRFALQEKGFAL